MPHSGVIAVTSLPLVSGLVVTACTMVAGRLRKPGATNSLPGRSGLSPGISKGTRVGTRLFSLSAATAVPLDADCFSAQPATRMLAPTRPRKPRRVVGVDGMARPFDGREGPEENQPRS